MTPGAGHGLRATPPHTPAANHQPSPGGHREAHARRRPPSHARLPGRVPAPPAYIAGAAAGPRGGQVLREPHLPIPSLHLPPGNPWPPLLLRLPRRMLGAPHPHFHPHPRPGPGPERERAPTMASAKACGRSCIRASSAVGARRSTTASSSCATPSPPVRCSWPGARGARCRSWDPWRIDTPVQLGPPAPPTPPPPPPPRRSPRARPTPHRPATKKTWCSTSLTSWHIPSVSPHIFVAAPQPPLAFMCLLQRTSGGLIGKTVCTPDYVFELHGYIQELLEAQESLKHEVRSCSTASMCPAISSPDPKPFPFPSSPPEHNACNSLQQYSLTAASSKKASGMMSRPRCFSSRCAHSPTLPGSGLSAARTRKCGTKGDKRDWIGSDGSLSSEGLSTPSPPSLLPQPGLAAAAARDNPSPSFPRRRPSSPMDLPMSLAPLHLSLPPSAHDASFLSPAHLPFPSVLLSKSASPVTQTHAQNHTHPVRPAFLNSQRSCVSGCRAEPWQSQHPPPCHESPPGPPTGGPASPAYFLSMECGNTVLNTTADNTAAEQDARLLMDLRTIPPTKDARKRQADGEVEHFLEGSEGCKKRPRLGAMAVDRLVSCTHSATHPVSPSAN